MKPSKNEIKKRDRQFQEDVVSRDKGKCILHNIVQREQDCWVTVGVCAHHIIKRRFLKTRWDLKNGATLCLHCHDWAESFPIESEILIIGVFIVLGIISDRDAWENFKRLSIS